MSRLSVVVIVSLMAVAQLCQAAVPPMISYQGKLMQPTGAPVPDGTYPMQFGIYDVPAGGNALWSETNPSVQVKGGLFSVLLGSVVNLPGNIFDSPDRWFGVKVGTDPEMMPRQKIASVAYAVKAGSSDVALTVPDGAITTSKVAPAAITTDRLALGAVTADRLAPAAVTADKLAPGVAIPPGTILMWSGATTNVPQGWKLCNGTNGTPDLRDRFIVGAGLGYAVGVTGGEATHKLTVAEMPRHNHDFTVIKKFATSWADSYLTCGQDSRDQDYTGGTGWITYTGGGQPHENRPPYYALCFIMKL